MARRSPGRGSWLAVVAAAMMAAGLWAAPILPTKPALPDEVRSLANIKQVSIIVDTLPSEMRQAGVQTQELEAIIREVVLRAGFEVVDDATPRLVLQCFTTSDPSVPGGVAMTTLLGVNQPVHVQRLDQEMVLPVSTVVKTGLSLKEELKAMTHREVTTATQMFVTFVRQASE